MNRPFMIWENVKPDNFRENIKPWKLHLDNTQIVSNQLIVQRASAFSGY